MRRLRIVLLLVLLLAVLLIWARSRAGVPVEPGSALIVDLRGEYVEAPAPSLVMRLLGRREVPLAGLLSELAKAERDERITTVLARVGPLDIGWAKAQEIRGALSALREKGKRVVAYLEVERYGANIEYYVAAAADELVLAPGTRTPFAGLAAEYLFLGGLFEKVGIEIEVERIGRYKSATETLAGTKMSEAHREMANAILDSIEGQFVGGVATGRGLEEAEVRAAIDAAPTTPEEFVRFGLADAVQYESELLQALGDPPTVEGDDYAGVDPASLGFDPQATFALVYGSGPVVVGDGSVDRTGDRVLASRTISQALLDASDDPEVDAVLFRIDSPGGSALASDLVWHAVSQVREKGKPLVVSLSDVAASGGYYVAAAADAIVADPATLTGSIGVFVLRPVLGGLYEKLGIGAEALTRGRHADLLVASRPLSPGSRERLRADVENVYELFVSRVATGRDLERDEVDAVGRGRVWTGEQALERGLVDALGGLREASRRAREALGLAPDADVRLVPYPPPRSLADQLREGLGVRLAGGLGVPALPPPLKRLAALLASEAPGGPTLVPPLLVEIR